MGIIIGEMYVWQMEINVLIRKERQEISKSGGIAVEIKTKR